MLMPHLLRCEYLVNPIGIEVTAPRLSWAFESTRRGARQTAYQIQAWHNSPDNSVWDTGKILSDQHTHIVYAGEALASRQRIFWQVRVWDEQDAVFESDIAFFEMGLLARDEWQAQWIGSSMVGAPQTSVPCPYLRKAFRLTRRPQQARLYITALGVYEATLNGQAISEDVLRPGWTDYTKRVPYQVYDVTALLQTGENVIGAILGDGWFCGYLGWQPRQHYGDAPMLCAQLMLDFEDGTTEMIATDGTWQTTTGAIMASDMLMGESYHAGRELPGWDAPGYDASRWLHAQVFTEPGCQLVAQTAPPVRRKELIEPIKAPQMRELAHHNTVWIFDFGENMVGRVRLKISGKAGTTIKLRYAEILNPDGTLYIENLRAARATDYYTLHGTGQEIYEPHFTFHGFRYAEISGFEGIPTHDTLTAIVLYSDTPPTGSFECSDPLINQLQKNIVRSQKGNFLEVPTDCPQRDERLGWTGDAQVFIRTATFNMDVAAFFTKWQQDIADAQISDGRVPSVCPNVFHPEDNNDGGPAWADAILICPWTIYQIYGDTRLLAAHYESFQRFMAYLENTSLNLIRAHPLADAWGGYGDWLSLHPETPKDLIGTAFFAHCAHLMRQIATLLNQPDDAEKYSDLHSRIVAAFQNRFVTPDGLLVAQTQTAYVLALHFDLLPEKLRLRAIEQLVRDIERRGIHLSTGFVGTPYLLPVLTKHGKHSLATALLHQTTYPSWLYPVTQGATSIWERWDGWTEDKGFQSASMNSFNHYAYGSVGEWIYSSVGGIDTENPGFKQLILRPRPTNQLNYAKATYRAPAGLIESEWRREPGQFEYRVTVPPNTTATVYLPAFSTSIITENDIPVEQAAGVTLIHRNDTEAVYQVVSGKYVFSVA